MFEFFNLLTHLPFTTLREGGQTAETRQNIIICKTTFIILFHLYIYPPDSQESVGGAIYIEQTIKLMVMPRYCFLNLILIFIVGTK